MKKTSNKKSPTADEIAELAMKGNDVSKFFTNKGEMRSPVQRVRVRSKISSQNSRSDLGQIWSIRLNKTTEIASYFADFANEDQPNMV